MAGGGSGTVDLKKCMFNVLRCCSVARCYKAYPAAALKAEGINVPAGMTVTVVENTDRQFHLVLPPSRADEMSDEALRAVAGGLKKCG